jgi:hypothetical protein
MKRTIASPTRTMLYLAYPGQGLFVCKPKKKKK